MEVFTKHIGQCVPLFEQNIDTDQIVPKKFLLSISRTGFDKALFYDWRFYPDGKIREEFVLNDPKYSDPSILLTGANFGCGSSREHAPWALAEFGFRVIIAPGFADIFYNNCFKSGLLPIELDESLIRTLVSNTKQNPRYDLTVDLIDQRIFDAGDFSTAFRIDAFRKDCLLNGFDDIDLTLLKNDRIAEFEKNRITFLS